MRDCISLFYTHVLNTPSPEELGGVGGTISEIQSGLNMRRDQRQRILNVVAKTHHALLTGKEYESMREFCVGSKSIKPGRIEEQAVADLRERGLSYTETTLLTNHDCLQIQQREASTGKEGCQQHVVSLQRAKLPSRTVGERQTICSKESVAKSVAVAKALGVVQDDG